MMDIRELDRLTSKTVLTPATKQVLRSVRSAVIEGRVGGLWVREDEWVVTIENHAGQGVRCRFEMRSKETKHVSSPPTAE